MNNSIEKIRVLNREQLNEEFYLESLIQQAFEKGLLTDVELERIQFELMNLLAYKTERYTTGDSSSIPMDKARIIMTSSLFTIGLWLKTYAHPDDAVNALIEEPIDNLYKKGRTRIDTMLGAAKAVHKKLLESLIDVDNEFYRATADDGIKGFFKLYYPDFTAAELHITADYPVFNPMPKLAGIEFISRYLKALYYENEFCTFFRQERINAVLRGYNEGYPELLFNIYEQVLIAALGCVIAGEPPETLNITKKSSEYLQNYFAGIDNGRITALLENAVSELSKMYNFSEGLALYIKNSIPVAAYIIESAARRRTLARVFFLPKNAEDIPAIILSYGEKMDDEDFRKVLSELNSCENPEDKYSIIAQYTLSLADLEDILLYADLSHVEISAVLLKLSPPQIAALIKRYPLNAGWDGISEREQLLAECLNEILAQYPAQVRDVIQKIVSAIKDDE